MTHPGPNEAAPLTTVGRYLILICAFLGWLCAGVQMSITQLVGQPAAIHLLAKTGRLDLQRYDSLNKQDQAHQKSKGLPLEAADREQLSSWKSRIGTWFAWYQCAFLFGAATGGLVFGWLGDRIGRSKAMAASILMYSLMAALASLAQSPEQLLVIWYLACTGVGGMWPNGVALVSEAWANLSRPMVAGVIGTSANIGIFLFSSLATWQKITPHEWRWAMTVGATPFILGVISWLLVPESPKWLASRNGSSAKTGGASTSNEIFRPPLLGITLVGILLATIPIIGGWSTANWMIPWAAEAAEGAASPNPYLKAQVNQARAVTGIVGSLLGGWIASVVGRRRTYFLVSLACLLIAQYTFWFVVPTDRSFLFWVAGLGFFSGIYFGWLPLFLPELFPTRVRSTGAGVSFNFGRILTAFTVFATGMLMTYFEGNYARIGRITSLAFALGMIVIALAPDTSQKQLED